MKSFIRMKFLMINKINGLREYKYWLIGTITPENKKEINKRTREIDKEIKKLLKVKTQGNSDDEIAKIILGKINLFQ